MVLPSTFGLGSGNNMSTYMRGLVSVGALACALIVAPGMAGAFTSNSCLEGFVEAHDYAELEERLAESFVDRKARLVLNSESAELTLSVSDLDGNSVCENIADLNTRCDWNLGDKEIFVIKIDNTMRATQTAYELCAR